MITIEEIKKALSPDEEESMDDKLWNSIVSEVDKDGNGEINFEEF